jgi:hypothetical protein
MIEERGRFGSFVFAFFLSACVEVAKANVPNERGHNSDSKLFCRCLRFFYGVGFVG